MYVYFIRAGTGRKAPVKIGIAEDPKGRLNDLQTGNHLWLQLLGTIKCRNRRHALDLERKFHMRFRGKNLRGEWFKGPIPFRRSEEYQEQKALKKLEIQIEEEVWAEIEMVQAASEYI